MRKPNPIDTVSKEKEKFDTKNLIIDLQLIKIEFGKSNNGKQI